MWMREEAKLGPGVVPESHLLESSVGSRTERGAEKSPRVSPERRRGINEPSTQNMYKSHLGG